MVKGQLRDSIRSIPKKNEKTIGTISGISHRMDQITRRLVVTYWRATMIGLRRKNILIYLHPDDHMLDMWQKDYVLQLDNWRKQRYGCSRTWQITVRSSGSWRRLRTPDSRQTLDSVLQTPEEENSVIPKSGRPHDRYVIGLCFLIRQLEKTVVRLQQDIAD